MDSGRSFFIGKVLKVECDSDMKSIMKRKGKLLLRNSCGELESKMVILKIGTKIT